MKPLERITLIQMVVALVIMQAVTLGALAILIVEAHASLCHF